MFSKSEIKNLEKKFGIALKKKLGQNFLIDANIKDKLLNYADINKDDVLLEIGSGLGQLTLDLSRSARKVIAIEFDKKLFFVLSGLIKDSQNIVLVHEDFLKFNLKEFVPKNKKVKVISNLPYYISTPIILKLFAHSEYIDYALLTLQKELADRLTAEPGKKEYGSLTLFAEFHSEIKRQFNIKRNSFYPVPKVDSSAISMKMRRTPPVSIVDKKVLFDLIRASFSTRRKTLVNSLLSQDFLDIPKQRLQEILKVAGIPLSARAETLSLEDFAKLSNYLSRLELLDESI